MKRTPAPQRFSFQSRLERLAPGINYFALSVPEKITQALKTRGPVPVSARVNDSAPFLVSLFPLGGGRHALRVKAQIRNQVGAGAGDRVRVEITVLSRTEVSVPKDLAKALRAKGLTKDFNALPIGQRRYAIRRIDEAAKPETREKRIQDTVELTRRKK